MRQHKTIPAPSYSRTVLCVLTLMSLLIMGVTGIMGPQPAAAAALSDRDVNIAKKAFDYLDKGQWRNAEKIAQKLENQDARDLVRWVIVSEPKSGATFEALSDFLVRYPDWPNLRKIQRRAEEVMPLAMAPGSVLGWFARHEPVSTEGKIRRANALLAIGKTEEGRAAVRDTWATGRFGRTQFRNFYRKNRKHLTHQDHVDRLDWLIWNGRHREARRMLYRVNKDYRALGEARILLMRMEGNVDSAIAKVPLTLKNDAGLVYERLRWRRRKGRDVSARALLDQPPTDLRRPDKWWQERRLLARRAIRKNDFVDAYVLAVNHGLEEPGKDLAEAEWLSGWLALRKLNKPKTALGHFQALYQSVKFPISRARGAYWLARTHEHLGDRNQAKNWYQIAAQHSNTYYGQLAWAQAYPGRPLVLAPDPELPLDLAQKMADHPLTAQARILAQIDEQDRIRPFIRAIAASREDPAWKALAAQLAGNLGRPDLSIHVAKQADRAGLTLPNALFPTLTPPDIPGPRRTTLSRDTLEVPLVLAMIRQESAFRPRAKSHANARGLMQIIPGTAYKVAKRVGLKYSKSQLLSDPVYNMKLGQAYMAGLLEDFNGSYVLALSAYNAGPARARHWVRLFGDPSDPKVDAVDWVEKIPFEETRNYVQRVLENTHAYRYRLKAPELATNMAQDLAR